MLGDGKLGHPTALEPEFTSLDQEIRTRGGEDECRPTFLNRLLDGPNTTNMVLMPVSQDYVVQSDVVLFQN